MTFRKILRYPLITNNQQVLFDISQILNTVVDRKAHICEQCKYILIHKDMKSIPWVICILIQKKDMNLTNDFKNGKCKEACRDQK